MGKLKNKYTPKLERVYLCGWHWPTIHKIKSLNSFNFKFYLSCFKYFRFIKFDVKHIPWAPLLISKKTQKTPKPKDPVGLRPPHHKASVTFELWHKGWSEQYTWNFRVGFWGLRTFYHFWSRSSLPIMSWVWGGFPTNPFQ